MTIPKQLLEARICNKDTCEEIRTLKQENQRLNNDIKILLKENEAKEKVIIKQDNVLNEFEKWLIDLKTPKTNYWGDRGYTYMLKIDVILDKLNELKEKYTNE